jgi:hypothetical protein
MELPPHASPELLLTKAKQLALLFNKPMSTECIYEASRMMQNNYSVGQLEINHANWLFTIEQKSLRSF